MAGPDSLGKSFEARYRKDRRLVQEKRKKQTETPSEVTDRSVTIRTNAKNVLAKADTLLSSMKKLAIRRTVPVREDARDVRAAVRRKREGSGGEFIDLDLYLDALDYLEREKEAIDADVMANLPGDAATAAGVLDMTRTQKVEKVNQSDAAYMVSQAFTLVMLKLLNKGLDNIDTQGQTGGKQPASTEMPALAAGIAISIIMRLLITNLLEDEVSSDLADQPGFENITQEEIDASMEEAKATLQNMRAFRLAQLYKNPSDYRLIVDYVQNFLAEAKDPGWEEWQMIPDIKATGADIRAVVAVMDAKVPDVPVEAEQDDGLDLSALTGPNSPLGSMLEASRFVGGRGPTYTSSAHLKTPHVGQSPKAALDIYEAQVKNANGFVNKVAAVLSFRETQDQLCCLVRIAGGFDPTTLKIIRTALNAAMDAIGADVGFMASGHMNQSWTLGRRAATRLLWELMDGYESFVDQLWEYVSNNEVAQKITTCQPIDEIFTFIADWAKTYLDKLSEFVLKYVDVLTITHKTSSKRLSSVASLKKIRRYAAILDMVASAVDRGDLCAPDDTGAPSADEVATAASAVLSGLPETLSVPYSSDEDTYVSFKLDKPIELDNGIMIPDARESSDPSGVPMKINQDECRKRLSGADVTQFDAFVRELNEHTRKISAPDLFTGPE